MIFNDPDLQEYVPCTDRFRGRASWVPGILREVCNEDNLNA